MFTTITLLFRRRFLPLFVTQALGAFNDNLFKNAMVFFVVYELFNDARREEQFSGLATAIFVVPFFLFSALAGQLADSRDKASLIRLVKLAEIFIMLVGAAGLLIGNIPLMLAALLGMGIHSSFFGPIKYAILPQHLAKDEVLAGTGLVEAGTYLAILGGTIVAGFISAKEAAIWVIAVALIGYVTGRQVPPAPPIGEAPKVNWNVFQASYTLIRWAMPIPRLWLAIVSISFFWTIGAILFIQFPPLVKNVFHAEKAVASLFLCIFSVGIALGSVLINLLLKNRVSARYSPVSVVVMGGFIVAFYFVSRSWVTDSGPLLGFWDFLKHDGALQLALCLLGVATAGGMFVVPLYAFLTTTVDKSQTARAVGANNFVNAVCMTSGSLLAFFLTSIGIAALDQFLLAAAMSVISAWLAVLLWRVEGTIHHHPSPAVAKS